MTQPISRAAALNHLIELLRRSSLLGGKPCVIQTDDGTHLPLPASREAGIVWSRELLNAFRENDPAGANAVVRENSSPSAFFSRMLIRFEAENASPTDRATMTGAFVVAEAFSVSWNDVWPVTDAVAAPAANDLKAASPAAAEDQRALRAVPKPHPAKVVPIRGRKVKTKDRRKN